MERSPVEVIEGALRAQFPNHALTVMSHQHQFVLHASDGQHSREVRTPTTIDARHESVEYWIHRFSQALRQ